MGGQNEENLRELFEKFYYGEQAEKAVEDIQEGEQILRKHPAPEPDRELKADIKMEMAEAGLRREGVVFRRRVYKTAVVAAAFIIVALVGVKLFEKGAVEPEKVVYASIIPSTIWESDDIAADDAELAVLAAEIEQTEQEVLAIQLGEANGNGQGRLTELEMELIEINSDFWKG